MYEVCITDYIGKHLCDAFPLHGGVKQGDVLSLLLFICTLEYFSRKVQENQEEQVNSLNPGTCLCL
jgi:hypothetical protein